MKSFLRQHELHKADDNEACNEEVMLFNKGHLKSLIRF